ncbi:MAG: four helix bundle protein [Candidatus Marinimicrobia bacterium]|nr:four helix bundle protein [Candidatus Neomarinimicrobiota bacterium]
MSQQDTDFTDQHHSERKVSNNINEPPLNYDSKRDFTSLEAWRKARAMKLFFYKRILPKLPVEEKYNLGSQIRDSGVSATANIAEGYGRFHYKEGIQFYRISRASIYELKDHLISCLDFDYINKELFNEGIRQS